MIEHDARILTFLGGLRRESGGYADSSDGDASLRATLSVLKARVELGVPEADPGAVDFVSRCRHGSDGFSVEPNGEPTPFDTATGLVALHTADRLDLLAEYLPSALAFMREKAATQFDHFMLIAAYEECGIADPVPDASVDFFRRQLGASLAAGNVVEAAIAGASLIRAGHPLDDPEAVATMIRAGQNAPDGGFGGDDGSSLFATYCAMRTLVLLSEPPDTRRLLGYLDSLATGFGYADAAGHKTSAGAIYQNLSMRTWLRQLQGIPVRAARAGDTESLTRWLSAGGDPDLHDADGWTVLLAAASHGQAAVVDLLLNHEVAGAPRADPSVRLEAADALPIYMAGQAGELETVKLLLRAAPVHLHAISSVNGHTVLLQAAFYGKEKHVALASYLLDHAAEIGQLPAEQLPQEQARLLSATNVRGFNALAMQDLWHNKKMKDLLLRYYPTDLDGERGRALQDERDQYRDRLLLAIAAPQALTEQLMAAIGEYLESDDTAAIEERIDALLAQPGLDIDHLGGELQMTPLIFAITGVDVGNPSRAERRRALATKLLDAGADPVVRERHPMAVGAVIRASVLNNFELLKLIAGYMTPEAFAREMNVSPAVNGLTAMHDAVHRALTSPPAELEGHIAQITWMIQRGANLDIPDHTGQTQQQLAESAQNDASFPRENADAVLAAVRRRSMAEVP